MSSAGRSSRAAASSVGTTVGVGPRKGGATRDPVPDGADATSPHPGAASGGARAIPVPVPGAPHPDPADPAPVAAALTAAAPAAAASSASAAASRAAVGEEDLTRSGPSAMEVLINRTVSSHVEGLTAGIRAAHNNQAELRDVLEETSRVSKRAEAESAMNARRLDGLGMELGAVARMCEQTAAEQRAQRQMMADIHRLLLAGGGGGGTSATAPTTTPVPSASGHVPAGAAAKPTDAAGSSSPAGVALTRSLATGDTGGASAGAAAAAVGGAAASPAPHSAPMLVDDAAKRVPTTSASATSSAAPAPAQAPAPAPVAAAAAAPAPLAAEPAGSAAAPAKAATSRLQMDPAEAAARQEYLLRVRPELSAVEADIRRQEARAGKRAAAAAAAGGGGGDSDGSTTTDEDEDDGAPGADRGSVASAGAAASTVSAPTLDPSVNAMLKSLTESNAMATIPRIVACIVNASQPGGEPKEALLAALKTSTSLDIIEAHLRSLPERKSTTGQLARLAMAMQRYWRMRAIADVDTPARVALDDTTGAAFMVQWHSAFAKAAPALAASPLTARGASGLMMAAIRMTKAVCPEVADLAEAGIRQYCADHPRVTPEDLAAFIAVQVFGDEERGAAAIDALITQRRALAVERAKAVSFAGAAAASDGRDHRHRGGRHSHRDGGRGDDSRGRHRDDRDSGSRDDARDSRGSGRDSRSASTGSRYSTHSGRSDGADSRHHHRARLDRDRARDGGSRGDRDRGRGSSRSTDRGKRHARDRGSRDRKSDDRRPRGTSAVAKAEKKKATKQSKKAKKTTKDSSSSSDGSGDDTDDTLSIA